MEEKDREDLHKRIDEIQETMKEREVSFLRSLKTLYLDWQDYKNGDNKEFPRAALLGAVFAYLRPRLVVTIAGLAAFFLGAMQVWLLLKSEEN